MRTEAAGRGVAGRGGLRGRVEAEGRGGTWLLSSSALSSLVLPLCLSRELDGRGGRPARALTLYGVNTRAEAAGCRSGREKAGRGAGRGAGRIGKARARPSLPPS